MRRYLRAARLAPLTGALAVSGTLAAGEEPCAVPGTWYDPDREQRLSTAEVTARLAERDFVLLGERHDDAEHHRWQLHTLAALLGRREIGAVGFEMLPRSKQSVLDAWAQGEKDAETFFEAADWDRVWGYDTELYRPLLDFVRMHRLPARALNVERETVRAVREEGWSALAPDEREDVGEPAPASEAYVDRLERTWRHHPGMEDDAEALERFVEAQTFWDRAMAEALAEAYEDSGAPVVGIVGRGHLEGGHGITHQLADLGYSDAAILLPLEAGAACPEPGSADLHFTLEPDVAEDPDPRMGIGMITEAGEVVIQDVMEGYPAADADLEAGDRIVEARGERIRRPGDMQRIVEEQPPGTWLPLKIERDGETREAVVRFPAEDR